MTMQYIIKKYLYYWKWYKSMTDQERSSVIGSWVLERVGIFEGIIKQAEKSISRWHRPVGNYTPGSSDHITIL
jgi:hypothetical protein